MKILFAGSPEPARRTLEILFENQDKYNFQIAGVLSNPPSAKGRHKELIPTPVAAYALEKNIPVFTPEHLNGAAREQIEPLQADLLVCFAYGHIFGPKFLGMFHFGGINLHPSLLPKYRGCTPVPAAIINRDEKTAATIQTLSAGMDEGNILAQKIIMLDGTETTESLLYNSAVEGASLILDVISRFETDGNAVLDSAQKQQGEPSYTKIITKEDARINWNESASSIEAKIRAYYPEPCSWTMFEGQPLRILAAKFIQEDDERFINLSKDASVDFSSAVAGTVVKFEKNDGIYIKTGNGILSVTKLQKQGKNAMLYKDFMNGARNFVGSVLQ